MNKDLIIGLILGYVGLGFAFSEFRRIKIIQFNNLKEFQEYSNKGLLKTLTYIFYPVICGRLMVDIWWMGGLDDGL